MPPPDGNSNSNAIAPGQTAGLADWLNTFGKERLGMSGFDKFLSLVEAGRAVITPKQVIDAVYNSLRVTSYDHAKRYDVDIDSKTSRGVGGMEVRPEGGWHYRLPTNRREQGWSTSGETRGRVSVNVYAEPELLGKLDQFCREHKAYYKTPDQLAGWQERHDPITIYFHQDITPDIENKLKQIVTPHVRGDNLHGRSIAPGISAESSPSIQEIEGLIKRADELDPQLGKAVRGFAYTQDPLKPSAPIEPKLSAGQKRAIEITLDNYEQHTKTHAARSSIPGAAVSTAPAKPSAGASSGKPTGAVINATHEADGHYSVRIEGGTTAQQSEAYKKFLRGSGLAAEDLSPERMKDPTHAKAVHGKVTTYVEGEWRNQQAASSAASAPNRRVERTELPRAQGYDGRNDHHRPGRINANPLKVLDDLDPSKPRPIGLLDQARDRARAASTPDPAAHAGSSRSARNAPAHASSDSAHLRVQPSSTHSGGKLSRLGSGVATRALSSLNFASIGSNISQMQRSSEEGKTGEAVLAGANVVADGVGVVDDVARLAKDARGAVKTIVPKVAEAVKNTVGSAVAKGAGYVDDAAKLIAKAAPVLKSIAPAVKNVVVGGARILGRIAPGLGIALETGLEDKEKATRAFGSTVGTVSGMAVGAGIAVGVAAATGTAAASVVVAPAAAAIAVGYAASEYTSIAIAYKEEAQRFGEKLDQSTFKAMGVRFQDEMKKRGATFDEKGKIDWADEKNYERMQEILKEQIAKAQGRIDKNSFLGGWVDFMRTGDSVVEQKNAESDKRIFESAMTEMGKFKDMNMAKLQEMKALKTRMAQAQAKAAAQNDPHHQRGVEQVQGGMTVAQAQQQTTGIAAHSPSAAQGRAS
jgi:hypothetical protein